MAKGRKQRLLEAVLTASFRPDRQGRLLLDEPLPEELPVAGSADARAAWGRLVEAQGRYRKLGAPDPWGFAELVRKLHRELSAGEISPMQRFQLLSALSFGPWRITTSDGSPWGEPSYSDEELRGHWERWARFEEPAPGREWSERDWAVQRHERGLEPVEAFMRAHADRRASQAPAHPNTEVA